MGFGEVAAQVFSLYGREEYEQALGVVQGARHNYPEEDNDLSFWEACLLGCAGPAKRSGSSPKVSTGENGGLRESSPTRTTLRGDAGLRDRYAGTKRRLAETTSDSERYGTSKSAVIEKILAMGGLSETERASIRLVNDLSRARRARADAVMTDDGRRLVETVPVVAVMG